VGFVAVSIYIVIGLIIGALAGYYGGIIDIIASRVIEIMLTIPTFFLIITVVAFLPQSIFNIMVVIGITNWPTVARLTRGEFLKTKSLEYVIAAQALGASDARTIFRHLLPNTLAPVFVTATFGIASAILTESTLSFLGFGVPPSTASWGSILSSARQLLPSGWWLTAFPGLAIFLTVTSYNLVGEGLRDAADPRLKG
jgi:peptide/nickel transport system permease protein